jgi:hypothetical protein
LAAKDGRLKIGEVVSLAQGSGLLAGFVASAAAGAAHDHGNTRMIGFQL